VTARTDKPAMLTVTDGRRVVGFILRRHWVGGYAVAFESFDVEQRSLGIFGSESEAAAAIPTAPEDGT
jgi:hypothetical protein